MKAMILAAGRGERMRPLTDHTPKPLLEVGGKPLIVWHIERLVAAGLSEIVINCAWLGDRLVAALGNGSRFNASIEWSREDPALETAGGIAQALPKLGDDAFLVVNGDVWCDWDFALAPSCARRMKHERAAAWLLLVDNPQHNPDGDFLLQGSGHIQERSSGHQSLTFSGIGVYEPQLFASLNAQQAAPLAPLLRSAMRDGEVLGDHHTGLWMDIGTPERLHELDGQLKEQARRRW